MSLGDSTTNLRSADQLSNGRRTPPPIERSKQPPMDTHFADPIGVPGSGRRSGRGVSRGVNPSFVREPSDSGETSVSWRDMSRPTTGTNKTLHYIQYFKLHLI